MRIYENGIYRDMTPEELAQERQYWFNTSYNDAVNNEIRKKYSESQEFAILRQATVKPEEYKAYFAYCEECKTYVKAKQKEVLA